MKRYTVFLAIPALLFLLLYVTHPLSAQTTGSISGVVTALDGTTPITDAMVCINEYHEVMGYGCVSVDSIDATYTFTGLPSGLYRVEANAPDKENKLYPETPFYNQAMAIQVTAPDDTPSINFTLGPGSSISGTITGTTLPFVAGAWMCVNSFDSDDHVRCRADALDYDTGAFLFDHLPSGSYRVDVTIPGYIREFYNGTWNANEASPIEVAAPTDITGLVFALDEAGGFSGTITEADGTTSIGDATICVNNFDQPGHFGCVNSNPITGAYTVNFLPTGNYRVDVRKQGHVNTYYPNTPFYSESQALSVTMGEMISGVNFALGLGGSISGTINPSNAGSFTNVMVCVNTFDTNQHVQCRDDSDTFQYGPNTYRFDGVPTGSYRVNVWAKDYRQEFYNNTPWYHEAIAVIVTAPSDTPNINFILDPAGTISGTVYASDGTTPLVNIPVDLSTGGYGRCTDENGRYTLESLPLNTALVIQAGGQGWPQCPGQGHLTEWWQETNSEQAATPITL